MDHALYMYYIDDGHNVASRKTQMRMVGLGIPGTQDMVMALCKPSDLCNTMISTNLTNYFNVSFHQVCPTPDCRSYRLQTLGCDGSHTFAYAMSALSATKCLCITNSQQKAG
jgi:hypothetical protein